MLIFNWFLLDIIYNDFFIRILPIKCQIILIYIYYIIIYYQICYYILINTIILRILSQLKLSKYLKKN